MSRRERGLAKRRKAVAGDVVPSIRRTVTPDDGPSPEDLERFGGVTQTCPQCGTELFDDVAVCWKCGYALMGNPVSRRLGQFWMWVVVALVIVAFILAFAL